METIMVYVNGKTISLPRQSTITDLIRQMNTSPRGIAIAVLTKTSTSTHESIPEIIPQQQWTTYLLLNQQNILIIKATQGG